ncbi:ABC transporter substrate-binding protein [bacterium]|nr:ABC transporter substrate-binding protein [bacterium]
MGCNHSSVTQKNELPLRIVSLTPSLTETIFSIGAGRCVVGVTDNDDYPPEVGKIAKVGDMYPNLELIVSLEPDLVIYDKNFLSSNIQDRLQEIHLPTLALQQSNLNDLYCNLEVLGKYLNCEEGAKIAQRHYKELLEKLSRNKIHYHKSALIVIWHDPLMTVGNNSFINDLINLAGLKNCYDDLSEPYPLISMEDLLRRDPDLIYFTYDVSPQILQSQGWRDLQAVKLERVCNLPSGVLQRPTLRALEGAYKMQKFSEVVFED